MNADFAHVLVVGRTKSGKSHKMKQIAKGLAAKKQKVIGLVPFLDSGWPSAMVMCKNVDELDRVLSNSASRGAFVFIDEAGIFFKGIRKTHKMTPHLLTVGRHMGYTVFMGSQRPAMVDMHARGNFEEAICFRPTSKWDIMALQDTYGELTIDGKPLRQVIQSLPQYNYIHIKVELGGEVTCRQYAP